MRRYENLSRGQSDIVPLSKTYSTTSNFGGNEGPTGLQVLQPQISRPNPFPPMPTQIFHHQFEQSDQVSPTSRIAPHASVQTSLDFGHAVIQSSSEGNARPPKPKQDDPRKQCFQGDDTPPRRTLRFPAAKKGKGQVSESEVSHKTQVKRIKLTNWPPKTASTATRQDNQKTAGVPTSPRKKARKARASKPQTQVSKKQKTPNSNNPSLLSSSDPLEDNLFHASYSPKSLQNSISCRPPLPIEDMRDLLSHTRSDTAKHPITKRIASQATTVSSTSTERSSDATKRGSSAKEKGSRTQIMKIDENLVLKKDLCDLVETRVQQGDASALNLLWGEIAVKLFLKEDEKSFEGIIKMLES